MTRRGTTQAGGPSHLFWLAVAAPVVLTIVVLVAVSANGSSAPTVAPAGNSPRPAAGSKLTVESDGTGVESTLVGGKVHEVKSSAWLERELPQTGRAVLEFGAPW